jgi:hypothetical protein
MEGVSMTLTLTNEKAKDKFFQPPSKFYNHKVVEILSINEDSGIATVILEKYTISRNANVYKNNNVFTIELPYSEFQYLRGWNDN